MKKELLKSIQNGREDIFYNSWTWRKKRLEIIDRSNRECQFCKAEGKVTIGTSDKPLIVHHIKHLKDRPDLGVSDENLIVTCHYHHELEHPEKLMKYRGKRKEAINEERW